MRHFELIYFLNNLIYDGNSNDYVIFLFHILFVNSLVACFENLYIHTKNIFKKIKKKTDQVLNQYRLAVVIQCMID